MKTVILLSFSALFTGCALGTSTEIKRSEELIQHFQCKNIQTDQLSHNPIVGFHERTLAVSKDKSEEYLERYKSGETLFDMPLNEVIQNQYKHYKSACEFLGGINTASNESQT